MMFLYAKLFLITALIYGITPSMPFAATNPHSVVRSEDGQFVRTSDANCVRTRWSSEHDACATELVRQTESVTSQEKKIVPGKPEARKTNELTHDEKTIYFVFNRSTLTPEGTERLATLARILKADQSVKEAKIVGYADRIGSNEYNQQLSQKRAESVRDYLIDNGYTNARVTETRWVGEEQPSTNCGANEKRAQLIECLQNDRRVEVEMVYLNDKKQAQVK